MFSILMPVVASANTVLIRDFVTRMYVTALGREPDPGGLNFWSGHLQSGVLTGAQTAEHFIFSPEMARRNLSNAQFIEIMYNTFFGRPSESNGRNFWLNHLNNGVRREIVFEEFVNSPEFAGICNRYNIVRGHYVAPVAPVTPPESEFERFANEVFQLTNIERVKHGLSQFRNDNNILNQAAMVRAEEIIRLFSHTRPDGRGHSTVYTDLGGRWTGRYIGLGENIAHGYTTPDRVVQAWMNSPGHRAIILMEDLTQLGVGVVRDASGRLYWVQLFYG